MAQTIAYAGRMPDRGTLDERYYMQSVLKHGYMAGILSDGDLASVSDQLMELLAQKAGELTDGSSSSISVETAGELMSSMTFVTGVRLKEYERSEHAAEAVRDRSLTDLFQEGLDSVRCKVSRARRIHRHITEGLFETPSVYYRSTVEDGISGFFRLYDPETGAHKLHITVDYPAFRVRPQLDGIEFIERYLSYIEAEDSFCRLFRPEDVHNLMCGITPDYPSCPVNIFEPVMMAAVGLVICGRPVRTLALCMEDISRLSDVFREKSLVETSIYIEKAVRLMDRELGMSRSSMRYAVSCVPQMAMTVREAVKNGTLDNVFVIPASDCHENEVKLTWGEGMSADDYSSLVSRLETAGSSSEKADLILDSTDSMSDFADLVSDGLLDREDIRTILGRLPAEVIEVLKKQYPDEFFMDRDGEKILCSVLKEFA